MKKIAMFTMGTRGDVQPYIYLCKALMKEGFEVTLGSHPCWEKLICDAGIIFEPIGPDIDIEKEAAIIRGKNSNPAISMLKTMNFVFRIIKDSSKEIYEVCKGKDLIIVSHSQMGATEAEVLGIPTVNVTLQKEMIPEKLKNKSFKDKMVGNMIGKQVVKPYNKIRKLYGLKPLASSEDIFNSKLNLIPISEYVLERNPYWDDTNILTGYWYDEEDVFVPDEKLKKFLDNGDKPIILALGAMSFEAEAEKDKLDMFVNSFKKTGYRAIIQGFQKTLLDYELPDTMLAIKSVPHSYLFGQGCFVIHHCGFGTSAATLIYGIPSIPVPHVLDQIGFANVLYENNVSTKPVLSSKLNEETITEAILEMKENYTSKSEAIKNISEKIHSEGGVNRAAKLIIETMNW